MVSLKNKQSGFTLVELLIVIVVIGILAALVITTFSGVQQRARNAERQTDVNAVASQLEKYYADNGSYPTAANIADASWRSAQGFRIDTAAFKDPSSTQTNLVNQTTEFADTDPTTPESGYFYWTDGTRYKIAAKYEGTVNNATNYIKKSN